MPFFIFDGTYFSNHAEELLVLDSERIGYVETPFGFYKSK
jgi:hypothetical protein